ncbi:hypothetical protein QBC46DRAFT_461632 [Diplogelasinospora grovesii]|uniref:Uncharacterized protein n=1 Tax=Diplogelasinospora grovesii TaxID=303347 RepID=A0AAN6MZU6_9PEZI|nr:hypothetical protein QBC46DRAFT_461632 [Diplogelasinospora grovesii]
MGNKNPPDERVVYLALKNVFKGSNAEVRQPKAIRKLIVQHQSQHDIADLSTFSAKLRFPEVFDVSPAQSAERKASEVKAARNEADAIRDAVQGRQTAVRKVLKVSAAVGTESVETCRDPKLPTDKRPCHIPSLFPHQLLTKVQDILEQACFDFGRQAMPDILRKNGWDCPEAAELNLWTAEFQQQQSEFADKQGGAGKPLDKLFRSVADIRHAAVHRIRVSARGIEQFILDAESLATLLGDAVRLKSLTDLRRGTQLAIEELERNKHLSEIRKNIAIQRAELARLEEVVVAEMIKEDGEYQTFAGTNLKQVILASGTFYLPPQRMI